MSRRAMTHDEVLALTGGHEPMGFAELASFLHSVIVCYLGDEARSWLAAVQPTPYLSAVGALVDQAHATVLQSNDGGRCVQSDELVALGCDFQLHVGSPRIGG